MGVQQFFYNGTINPQSFPLIPGVSTYNFVVIGAGGGAGVSDSFSGVSSNGGSGAVVKITYTNVTETLNVVVGGGGPGGRGGLVGGTGGGLTQVYSSTQVNIISGGGGGGSGTALNTNIFNNGGHGGTPNGQDGNGSSTTLNGKGGTTSAVGTGGVDPSYPPFPGTDGGAFNNSGNGGDCGTGNNNFSHGGGGAGKNGVTGSGNLGGSYNIGGINGGGGVGVHSAGGGGAGYYGGGGGAGNNSGTPFVIYGGGGGGGSSFVLNNTVVPSYSVAPDVTYGNYGAGGEGVLNIVRANPGQSGFVEITWEDPPPTPTPTPRNNSRICLNVCPPPVYSKPSTSFGGNTNIPTNISTKAFRYAQLVSVPFTARGSGRVEFITNTAAINQYFPPPRNKF